MSTNHYLFSVPWPNLHQIWFKSVFLKISHKKRLHSSALPFVSVIKKKIPLHFDFGEMWKQYYVMKPVSHYWIIRLCLLSRLLIFKHLFHWGKKTLQFQATFIASDLKKLWCCYEWSLFKQGFADVPRASVPLLFLSNISTFDWDVRGKQSTAD